MANSYLAPPNPKSLPTFSHAPAGIQTLAVARVILLFMNHSFKSKATFGRWLHWRKKLYLVIRGVSRAGLITTAVREIDLIRNLDFLGTSTIVYDFHPTFPLREEIKPFIHSWNMGVFYTNIVHQNELNYLNRTDKVAGAFSGTGHLDFKWRLVTSKEVTFEECMKSHPSCVDHKATKDNIIVFENLQLVHGIR